MFINFLLITFLIFSISLNVISELINWLSNFCFSTILLIKSSIDWAQSIDDLINKIVEKQKLDNQFINSDITFSEIEKIKKVIKRKLMNIYHVRVEYPD